MKLKILIFLAIFFSIAQIGFAAKISGELFDPNFENLQDVVVKINSTPIQQHIAKNSTYSFEISPGDYKITAEYFEKKQLKYEYAENIKITSEGNYVVDLILFPSIEKETLESKGIDLEIEEVMNTSTDVYDEKNNSFGKMIYFWIFIFGLVIITIFLVLAVLIKRIKKQFELEIQNNKQTSNNKNEKDYYLLILNSIEKEKQTTQKELRKIVPVSEAKVSLIISELESKGLVKKIKKGRGNIIMWNKDK